MLTHKEKELVACIEKFLENKEPAFEKLVKLIASDIVNIVHRYVGNLEDAKDISQEVFIKLHKRLQSFHHGSKVSTWIYRVAINASIDFLRRRKRTVSLKEDWLGDEHKSTEAIERIEQKDVRDVIKKGLEVLPMRQKNVIILKHFEGLTIRQISKIIGCSQSSVKTHLYRGVERLRKELGGRL